MYCELKNGNCRLKIENMKLALIISCLLSCNLLIAQPRVILKLDDIGANRTAGNKAAAVMDFLLTRGVKASYGIIAKRLDATAGAQLRKYVEAKTERGEAMVEFWHHGYDHSNNNTPANLMEYKGTSYAFQQANFNLADSLVFHYLGVQMHTFGAPFNAVDRTTLEVIAANQNYHAVFYFPVEPSKYQHIKRLNERVNMENGVGNPDFDYFKMELERSKAMEKPLIILQGHPLQWDKHKFEEFKQIIDYLLKKKYSFVLPSNLGN